MADYILSCCSTADLNHETFAGRDIHYVCFHFELNGESYMDDLGQSVPLKDFYRRMAAGEMTRTSQVSIGEYEAFWEPFLQEGKDILHLTLSSGISGTYNSAVIAAEGLRERYPDRKLIVIDSLAASAGFGLFMDRMADLRDAGYTIEEAADWAMEHRRELIHWVFTSDLTYLIRGGRVSKAAGTFGQLLNICPVIEVDVNGSLAVRAKVRTKKKVIRDIVRRMEEDARDGLDYDGKCFISNAACYEDARAVADLIEERFPKLDGGVQIFDIGTTIGSHTGPGTVALFFWGNRKREN